MSFSSQEKVMVQGAIGQIEVLCDRPEGLPKGIVVITHPHPLLGGTAGHKIPHQITRTVQAMGYLALRPNFRGAGAYSGDRDR
jgi:hypothetical protein